MAEKIRYKTTTSCFLRTHIAFCFVDNDLTYTCMGTGLHVIENDYMYKIGTTRGPNF